MIFLMLSWIGLKASRIRAREEVVGLFFGFCIISTVDKAGGWVLVYGFPAQGSRQVWHITGYSRRIHRTSLSDIRRLLITNLSLWWNEWGLGQFMVVFLISLSLFFGVLCHSDFHWYNMVANIPISYGCQWVRRRCVFPS